MELAAARGITQPGGLTSQPQTSNYPAVFTACFRIIPLLGDDEVVVAITLMKGEAIKQVAQKLN